MNKLKEINIRNHKYFYFDDLININNWRLKNITTVEKIFNDVVIHYIGHKVRYSNNFSNGIKRYCKTG